MCKINIKGNEKKLKPGRIMTKLLGICYRSVLLGFSFNLNQINWWNQLSSQNSDRRGGDKCWINVYYLRVPTTKFSLKHKLKAGLVTFGTVSYRQSGQAFILVLFLVQIICKCFTWIEQTSIKQIRRSALSNNL